MLGSRLILLLFRGYFLIKEEKLANLILCYNILENFLHSGYANFLITDWVVHLFLLPFCLVSSQFVMGTLILQENISNLATILLRNKKSTRSKKVGGLK